MVKNIIREVIFQNTSAQVLYDLYMNAEKHSLISGSPVTITEKEGDAFSAHQGYITGKNLQLVKDRLIVQSWRAVNWDQAAVDSTFIIYLTGQGNDVVLKMTHANVPGDSAADIDKGWFDHYWNP